MRAAAGKLLKSPLQYHSASSTRLSNIFEVQSCRQLSLSQSLTSARQELFESPFGTVGSKRLCLGRRVEEALANREPIVALESTVITHGMPEPENLQLAQSLEREIYTCHSHLSANQSTTSQQTNHNSASNNEALSHWDRPPPTTTTTTSPIGEHSANATSTTTATTSATCSDNNNANGPIVGGGVVTPATIGIIRGQLVVGLSECELAYLANLKRSRPIKASRRDVPIALGLNLSAGTTVAATMAIACSLRRFKRFRPGDALYQAPISAETAAAAAAAIAGGNSGQCHKQRDTATRVGPTSSISHLDGIKVFATGGIGGVHVGGQDSMDISADLFEFSRSPIGVVSAGFKSFLDTKLSLEYLETVGCTVMSLDDNNDDASDDAKIDGLFPGFLTRRNSQQIKSPCRVKNLDEAARIMYYSLEANYGTLNGLPADEVGQPASSLSYRLAGFGSPLSDARATLLAVPIPIQFAFDKTDAARRELDEAMRQVNSQVESLGLTGKEKTPLILDGLNRITSGRSLEANMALLRNNARIGALLAHKYALLLNQTGEFSGGAELAILVLL